MMNWYCAFCDKDAGNKCPYRGTEKIEGAVLATNAGVAYSYRYDSDDKPQSIFFWTDADAYPCNAEKKEDCPYFDANKSVDFDTENYLQNIEYKRKEDSKDIATRCAERTVTYEGVRYRLSYELFLALANGNEDEFVIALKHAERLE